MPRTPSPSPVCPREAPLKQHDKQRMPALPALRNALRNFISPPPSAPAPSFKIIHTFPAHLAASPTPQLHILDSSFNPPTVAHLRICLSALLSPSPSRSDTSSPASAGDGKKHSIQIDGHARRSNTAAEVQPPPHRRKRLLLLLATQNADKATTEAAFEHRLGMMGVLAEEIRNQYRLSELNGASHLTQGVPIVDTKEGDPPDAVGAGEVVVDIAVTKHARFVDKIEAIEQSGAYHRGLADGCGFGADNPIAGEEEEESHPLTAAGRRQQLGDKDVAVEQIHLIGFDTLTRLLDTKYYPPTHTLQPLQGLFGRHRVRVTRRVDDGDGGQQHEEEQAKQTAYLRQLARGDREPEGGQREWAERIELVEGRREGEVAVSSTKVRDAVRRGDVRALRTLVPLGVQEWISREGLYQDRT